MSLDYDFTSIKNGKEVCYTTDANGNLQHAPLTQLLLMLTMTVDMGEIKDENDAREFLWRLDIMSTVYGKFMCVRDDDGNVTEERNPTLDEMKTHIGFHTNVLTTTRHKFLQRVKKARDEQAKREAM